MRITSWSIVCVVLIVSGCAAHQLHQDGLEMLQEGKIEEGLNKLGKAVESDPENVEFKKDLYLAKANANSQWLAAANKKISLGDAAGASVYFKQILVVDPGNAQASEGLLKLRRHGEYDDMIAAAKQAMASGDNGRALALLRPIFAEDSSYPAALALQREIEEPLFRTHFQEIVLKDTYGKPINLEFRDASVRMILDVLSRTSGINFILDKDIPADLKTTVFLQNVYVDEAVDLIVRTSQLRQKVLNGSTVQIYPDTAEKRKDYQELVMRAFYLQDANVSQMQSTFKALLRMKDTVVDERLNLITVRDTPEAIRLAEQLVALYDLPEPEVMLEVEVLEVQHDDLLKLGIEWPNQLTLAPLSAAGGVLTLDDLKKLNSTRLGVSLTNPSIDMRQDHGVTNLLANPRIRVRNREKASIMIGDKIPVITTTSTSTGFVAESVQYLDVGLKLNVEPVIHANKDVSISLNMEVSSIASQVSTANGTVAYQIGTRNAATSLRLKDGETQILAGLISDQDQKSSSGVPGLSMLPILGRLFSAPTDSRSKTEIVLSITPRIVRGVARPESQAVEFWSGTENALWTKPVRLSDGVANQGKNAEAARVQAPSGTGLNSNQDIQFIWNGPNQVTVGEQFSMSLRVKMDGGTKTFPLDVNYDSSVLEVTDIVDGDLSERLHDGEKQNIELDSKGGKFSVDMSHIKASGSSVDGTLLTLKMRAVAAKRPTELRISKGKADAAGERVAIALPYALNVLP